MCDDLIGLLCRKSGATADRRRRSVQCASCNWLAQKKKTEKILVYSSIKTAVLLQCLNCLQQDEVWGELIHAGGFRLLLLLFYVSIFTRNCHMSELSSSSAAPLLLLRISYMKPYIYVFPFGWVYDISHSTPQSYRDRPLFSIIGFIRTMMANGPGD